MPGILWEVDGEREAVEATGVYRGVVKKNMIDTVREVKRPFLDVFIEDLFFEDADYPLTYVPMVNMVLPLKEGQEVWVYFNQQNHRYPVLWKLADKFDGEHDSIDKKFTFLLAPEGGVVTMPEAEETTEVYKISDSMWVISTGSYCVMHYGDSCVLMNAGGVFTNSAAANVVANTFQMDVIAKLTAKVEELDLTLGSVASKVAVDSGLVIEAASAVLKFAQNTISFAGGTFDCGGGMVAPGVPDIAGGPFLNSSAQKCFYCGAPQGAVSFGVTAPAEG
jgi:hypothetical protein